MAVTPKRRRKIVCLGEQYIWYIKEDDDFGSDVLHILSEDKKYIIAYPLHAQTPYAVSKGIIFQNYPPCGPWERYLSPLNKVFPVTPKFVSEIILWAVNGENAVRVVWNGEDIWL